MKTENEWLDGLKVLAIVAGLLIAVAAFIADVPEAWFLLAAYSGIGSIASFLYLVRGRDL